MGPDVVVLGQLARDLVLVVDQVPGPGESGTVRLRREMLGGKGANQAVALAQLGLWPALVAVAGDDDTAPELLAQAKVDGIDVSAVVRRRGTSTGLIVDVVDPAGKWRYLEDLPPYVLLTETDVAAAASLIATASWVSIQLQQPPDAALAAARLAAEAKAAVVLDGAPEGGRHQAELLAAATVVRADAKEASLLAGTAIGGPDDARRAAAEILRQGPSLVALAVGDDGNYFAWPGGELLLPLTPGPVADTTGAGDAFTAALIAGLARGYDQEHTARLAVAAAGATAAHPGGRPSLTEADLNRQLALPLAEKSMHMVNAPIVLGPNQPEHFYRGGGGIARLRGAPQPSAYSPEDWVGSTTEMFSRPGVGLSRLDGGETLRDAIAAAPAAFLGPHHVARHGADPALLVKILDTGQRLVVHFHPDRDFAARHLGSRYGKTEAWIILETRHEENDGSAGHVYLGFKRDADPVVIQRWVASQDTSAILDSLNKVAVAPGDAILVPAGAPHAIGAGITLVELQEPTDFSILLEWAGFAVDGAKEGHLGLGFDVALTALDVSGWDAPRLHTLRASRPGAAERPGVTRLLPPSADKFFRAERVDVSSPVTFDPGYAILIVISGDGQLTHSAGSLAARQGSSLLVPYIAGATTLEGHLQALRCQPPIA